MTERNEELDNLRAIACEVESAMLYDHLNLENTQNQIAQLAKAIKILFTHLMNT